MISRFNDNLLVIKYICESLKILAERALEDSNDDSCRALYNDIVKDTTGYIEEIDAEIDSHKNKGKWK